jgi:LacI family transcriptional regulator, galactose operon repressor
MKQAPNVALLIETSNAYARGLLGGIRTYLRAHGPWSIYLGEQRRGEPAPDWLRRWQGDGIIARIESAEIARALLKMRCPVVDVSAARHMPSLANVETDDAEIARLAAGHLLERGFRELAFCGDERFQWSNQRRDHFAAAVAAAGRRCHVYQPASRRRRTSGWEEEKHDLRGWLAGLPKPVGILAAYDIRGRQVLDVCRELEIDVPDQVAVIGVDNDELLCDLATPPMSSIVPDTSRTGFEAARMLDVLMQGGRIAPGARLVKPLGIVTRRSTDVLALEDAEVCAAIRYIREHATDGIKVDDVLRAVPLSRRVLESRFQKLLGRTPHDEIVRVQLERVKQLLLETDLPLAAIAERAGYKHVEYLTVVFKRVVGQPPSTFRQEHRG